MWTSCMNLELTRNPPTYDNNPRICMLPVSDRNLWPCHPDKKLQTVPVKVLREDRILALEFYSRQKTLRG
jgi:hypothetical protein